MDIQQKCIRKERREKIIEKRREERLRGLVWKKEAKLNRNIGNQEREASR